MPCSCGNTLCPCGIPCYCSEVSCKCQDCAIALPYFCKICNKPLMNDIEKHDICSCFMGESIALILENQEKPQRRLGNIPRSIDCFVPGKLMVNVLIPVPFLGFPHFYPQPPTFWVPPPPLMQTNPGKFSLISDDVLKSLCSKDSDLPTTAELNKLVDKSNGQSSDLPSSGTNCAQEESCPPPGFLPLIPESQTVNLVENTKPEIEHASIETLSTFYLPSVMIGKMSYPVRLADPIWILPNPKVSLAGGHDSCLNLYNPFYVAGPVHAAETESIYEKGYLQPPFSLDFAVNGMQCRTKEEDGYIQVGSTLTLQMAEQIIHPDKVSEQSNLGPNGEYMEFPASSKVVTGNECITPLSLGYSNETTFPQNSEILENNLMLHQNLPAIPAEISFNMQDLSYVQSQPSYVTPSSTIVNNNYHYTYTDGCNPANGFANQTSDNVFQNVTNRVLANTELFSIPENPLSTASTQIKSNLLVTSNPTSKLQRLVNSSKENVCFQDNSITASARKERNTENFLPLYIDPYTIEKMGKLLNIR